MPNLSRLIAREVLDSRGRPTVEVEALADSGATGRAIVPSGASTGRHEAVELRDPDDPHYGGLGVRRAVGHVNGPIHEALAGLDLNDQTAIDRCLLDLDGTPNKSRLGANALLGASLAVAHAAAAARGVELFEHLNALAHVAGLDARPTLPLPMVNLISGGLHAGGNLDIQDVLMMPVGAPTYSEALEWTVAVYRTLGEILRARGEGIGLVGDEGGYGPELPSNELAIERVVQAIEAAGFAPGRDVSIALDVASTHFFDPDTRRYRFGATGAGDLDASAMVDLLASWVDAYPIVSIEDGLAEDDWDGWRELTDRLGSRVQLVGDDLFATQVARLQQGIDQGAANAVLIKVNQVGTLSETLQALALARRNGYAAVVSARSGETEDATIADLAVGTGAGQIKIGSVARSERLAKYNRLLRIEDRLGGSGTAPFAGRGALARA